MAHITFIHRKPRGVRRKRSEFDLNSSCTSEVLSKKLASFSQRPRMHAVSGDKQKWSTAEETKLTREPSDAMLSLIVNGPPEWSKNL
uniref:Uncharacterized protein n=1 Tax=Steinernema glaseri TaxID=37863 RepID=A0A1I7ZRC3_9BILA